jgi:hypothetical protein
VAKNELSLASALKMEPDAKPHLVTVKVDQKRGKTVSLRVDFFPRTDRAVPPVEIKGDGLDSIIAKLEDTLSERRASREAIPF